MSKTVLIVDDSIPLHKLIKTYLEPDSLTMLSTYDGEAGLVAAASLRPSLILLDVDMPRMDGFEMCRRLKANPVTSAIPVIFLTASAVLDDRVKGMDIGASDYISKPFKPQELRARIRAALRVRSELDSANLIDAPTGLWNRTYLDSHLDYHASLARRLCAPLSCIVAEVDQGRGLIEKFGEFVTCDLLRAAGRIFSGRCRAEDVVCRYDAWKFAILATGANRAGAGLIAERLRTEIERQLAARHGRETRITCSFGVADTSIADAATLVDRADAALSGAGRRVIANCVHIAAAALDVLNAVA